jgi:hypothetical protein
MARRVAEEQPRLLERGEMSFLYRPRVETFQPEGMDDIQRLLLVLCPDRKRLYRVIAIGRKRMPSPAPHERFWGFVDLVLDSPQDLRAALDAQTYGTKTRGVRHLPAAMKVAGGRYQIVWHGQHAHLEYDLSSNEADFEPNGDFIVTVANPDPTAWGLLETPPLQFELFDDAEVHVTIPTPFPPDLQQKFGEKRFVALDSTRLLNFPGAELVFISAASAPLR